MYDQSIVLVSRDPLLIHHLESTLTQAGFAILLAADETNAVDIA